VFSISTSWTSSEAETAAELINPILELGVQAIELEYRVTEEMFKEVLPALRRKEPAASSVHNFFPVPSGLRKEEGSGDAFLLSSPDRDERERAIQYTRRTLEFAYEAGAGAVVLHLGFTDMDDEYQQLKKEYQKNASADLKGRVRPLLIERRQLSQKYVDAALFSLDKLWRSAEQLSLKLGIENRNTLREVPDVEEMDVIFQRFEGAPIGYWHDTGHAAAQELFYGIGHEAQLSRFADRLIGIHLHDAEAGNDHMAPGMGIIDFEMVKKYVPLSAFRVIEVHSGIGMHDLRDGIRFLKERSFLEEETPG
jgi:sugar phosphate isomerase/epimerase